MNNFNLYNIIHNNRLIIFGRQFFFNAEHYCLTSTIRCRNTFTLVEFEPRTVGQIADCSS